MAMYNYNLYSFKQVEHMFDNTKPLRGSTITPLGDRARKWENIHKVSADCYVLLDNWSDPQHKGSNWYHTVEQLIELAAVKWTRNPDGSETIRIRNASGDYAHNSRYSFLQRALPHKLHFLIDSGKQYIRHDGKRHYLPKCRTITSKMLSIYGKGESFFCTEYDNLHVEFTKVVGGDWVLTSEPHKVPVTRVRVNKEEKKPYKEAIDTYLEWVWTMAPLLTTGEPESRSLGTFGSISRAHGFSYEKMRATRAECRDQMISHTAFRSALADETDEARTSMAICFMSDLSNLIMREVNWGETPPPLTANPKKFRAKFNSWINTYAGFNETFNEYKG